MSASMTKKELATVAGYSYRRLYDIDRDQPKEAKLFVAGEDGKYDLAVFVQRWVDYNVGNETGDESLDEVKAVHERVKIRKSEIELRRMEGELVDVTEVRKLWCNLANTVTQNFLRLPSKIAPAIAGLTNAEIIAAMIEREVRDVLNQIADTPLPNDAAGSGANDEGEETE